MGKIYTVTQFNTIDKLLTLLVRNTVQEAKEQIEFEIDCLKRKEKVLKCKMDYDPDAKTHLGKNEHNGYCKTEDAEYFWHTDCISVS